MTDFYFQCYYFGCHQTAGHYLFGPGMNWKCNSDRHRDMSYLDAKLAPKGTNQKQFEAKFWRLKDYSFGDYSAFSWWDRTVDSRMGSNSIIFVPGHIVDQITMVGLAKKYFPNFEEKISKLTLIPGFETLSRGTKND